MHLDVIEKIIKYINKLPSCAKTCIIIVLCGLIFINYIQYQNRDILKQYNIFTQEKEQIAEDYTFETASAINRCVSDISKKDTLCYNVMLLNYHNTQKSLQGYRYLYLNCLTEKPKGIEYEPLRDYWSNLEYIYYEDELSKIHNCEYLVIKHIDDIRFTMPKIYKKLKISGAEAAVFYTIQGKRNPIGLVIILYDKPLVKDVSKSMIYIFTDIQKLALLLDYENSKK